MPIAKSTNPAKYGQLLPVFPEEDMAIAAAIERKIGEFKNCSYTNAVTQGRAKIPVLYKQLLQSNPV